MNRVGDYQDEVQTSKETVVRALREWKKGEHRAEPIHDTSGNIIISAEQHAQIIIDGLKGEVSYHLREGDELKIHHFDERLVLKSGESKSRPLDANVATASATQNTSQSIRGQKAGS